MNKKPDDVVAVGNQQQVNVISIEDDEFSTDDEHVSFCEACLYTKCQLMLVLYSHCRYYILLCTQHICSLCDVIRH